MASDNVTIVATMKAKPDRVEEARELLLSLIEPTRAEAGCIGYTFHQDANAPGSFMFYETWASRQALDEHLATPHLKNLLDRYDELFAAPLDITFYDRIR